MSLSSDLRDSEQSYLRSFGTSSNQPFYETFSQGSGTESTTASLLEDRLKKLELERVTHKHTIFALDNRLDEIEAELRRTERALVAYRRSEPGEVRPEETAPRVKSPVPEELVQAARAKQEAVKVAPKEEHVETPHERRERERIRQAQRREAYEQAAREAIGHAEAADETTTTGEIRSFSDVVDELHKGPKPRRKKPSRRSAPDEAPKYKPRSRLSEEYIKERDFLQGQMIKFAQSEPNPGEITIPEMVKYLYENSLGDYRKDAPKSAEFRLKWALYELVDKGILIRTNQRIWGNPERQRPAGKHGATAVLWRLSPEHGGLTPQDKPEVERTGDEVPARQTVDQTALRNLLTRKKVVTTPEVQEELGLAHSTVRYHLDKLVNEGMLVKRETGVWELAPTEGKPVNREKNPPPESLAVHRESVPNGTAHRRGARTQSKDVNKILDTLESVHAAIITSRGDKVRVQMPGGGVMYTAITPKDRTATSKVKADVKRYLGVEL